MCISPYGIIIKGLKSGRFLWGPESYKNFEPVLKTAPVGSLTCQREAGKVSVSPILLALLYNDHGFSAESMITVHNFGVGLIFIPRLHYVHIMFS